MPGAEGLIKMPTTDENRVVTFDDFVGISNTVYKTIGMTSYDAYPGAKMALKNKMWLAVSLGVIVYAISGEITYFTLSLGNVGSNFLQMTALFPCICFCINGFTKIITILSYRKEVTILVIELKRMFPATPEQQKEYKVLEHNDVARYIFRSFTTFMIVWIWTFNMFALFISIFQYVETGQFVRRLPYFIWHPIDWNAWGWYELTYVYHISAGHCCTIPVIASDLLVGGLVTQICMHFDALKRRLAELKPSDQSSKGDLRNLVECIKVQEILYNISDRLESMFNFSILVNFIASVLIVCMCLFQITAANSLLDLVIYSLFLPSSVYQIFFLSYLGNQMIDSSLDIANGAYQGKWYNGSNQYMKYILLMIARAQRPQVLTALKFSVASLQSFNKIMSTSYQYFALLRTIYSD